MRITDPKEQYEITQEYLGPYAKDGIVVEKFEGKKGIVLIVFNENNINPRYSAFKTIKDKSDKNRISVYLKEAQKWFKVSGYYLILPALYIREYNDRPIICTPYYEIDLRRFIDAKKKFNEIETIIIVSQILKALIFSYSRGIDAHQDIKPENIMIKDLSKNNIEFPLKNIHDFVKYQIKVADFGMANAHQDSELPQGSYPYMAPEQYLPDKYDSFRPDIFALGVIIFEMITGKHPSGLKSKDFIKDLSRREKKKWAEKKNKLGINSIPNVSNKLKKLINEMLQPDPENRPSEDESLSILLEILSEIDFKTSHQLNKMFDYYDSITEYDKYGEKIDEIRQLSNIKSIRNELIKSIIREIKILKSVKKNPSDIVYLCDLCREVSWLLIKRNIVGDKDRAIFYAKHIFSLIDKNKNKLIYDDVYPDLSVTGFIIKREYHHRRDFELYCEYAGNVIDILEKLIGKRKTKQFFISKKDYVKSAYYYHIASNNTGDHYKAVQYLDKCILYNPKEPLFYFFKGLWLYFYYPRIDYIKNPKIEKEKLKKIIIENFDKAIKMDPNWNEPRIKKPKF